MLENVWPNSNLYDKLDLIKSNLASIITSRFSLNFGIVAFELIGPGRALQKIAVLRQWKAATGLIIAMALYRMTQISHPSGYEVQ